MNGFYEEMAEVDALFEELEFRYQQAGEVAAEAASETAAFGDAWGGASADVRGYQSEVARVEEALNNWFVA